MTNLLSHWLPFSLLIAGCATQYSPTGDDRYTAAAEEVVEQWTAELGPAFRSLSALPEQEFIHAWQGEHDHWRRRLDALATLNPTPTLAERYRARIRYEWAIGRLLYPAFHRSSIDDKTFQPSDAYNDYLEEIAFDRADLLGLDEYQNFLIRFRDQKADAVFDERKTRLSGDAQYLQAKRIANEAFENRDVRCFLETDALTDWLESFAADGLSDEPEQLLASCPGPKAAALLAATNADRAARAGHDIEIYKRIDGHELELHIYRPDDWNADDPPRSAIVWSHGGGWFFGSWSWCGPCRLFKERGLIVVQVEYRLRGRHGVDATEGLRDVIDAVAWIRTHANELGVDPKRIGAAGFSAGGHLSLAAATLEAPESPGRPDFAVSFSGCVDMTIDPYTIRMAGGREAARILSPSHGLRGDSPPLFLANAEDDPDCPFHAADAFVDRARGLGIDVAFAPVPDAGHFFFRDERIAAQVTQAVNRFLDERGY